MGGGVATECVDESRDRADRLASTVYVRVAVPAARAIAVVDHGWRELAGSTDRAYLLGEHPITRLKAVLNALSDS